MSWRDYLALLGGLFVVVALVASILVLTGIVR